MVSCLVRIFGSGFSERNSGKRGLVSNPLVEEKTMTKETKKMSLYSRMGAMMVAGMTLGSSGDAFAAAGNNFSKISTNIATSIASLPGLMSALAYLMGVVLGILGVLKIKDHVENPTQTPLKDGAVRLAVGGALFALPILFESMFNTIGNKGTAVQAATLKKATFKVN